MMVFNPISLYGAYLGWQEYEAILKACFYTGIVFIPFLWLAFEYMQNVLAPGGATHHAADHAVRHYFAEFILMIIACLIFVAPSITLTIQGVTYKPQCAPEGTVSSTPKDSGTTLDDYFANVVASQVKVPAGFILAQRIASGFTYGLMKANPCNENLSDILSDSVAYKLTPALRKEAKDFYSQCYMEAKNKFYQESPDYASYKQVMHDYGGEDDLNWLGSHTFRHLYYGSLKSKKPVKGFDYASFPSTEMEEAKNAEAIDVTQLPENGFPTCEAWWLKLRGKMVDMAKNTSQFDPHLGEASFYARTQAFLNRFKLPYAKKMDADDIIAKTLLEHRNIENPGNFSDLIYTGSNGTQKAMARAMVDFTGSVKSALSNPVEREGMIQGLPLYQAMGYFFIPFFAPFILILGRYRFSVCFSLASLLFVLTFFSYIWLKVSMFEQSLIAAYGNNGYMKTFHNLMTGIYLAAPVFLMTIMSITGVKLGGAIDKMFSQGGEESTKSGKAGGMGFITRHLGGK